MPHLHPGMDTSISSIIATQCTDRTTDFDSDSHTLHHGSSQLTIPIWMQSPVLAIRQAAIAPRFRCKQPTARDHAMRTGWRTAKSLRSCNANYSLDSTPLTPHPMAHRCALFRPHFIHPLPFRRIAANLRRVFVVGWPYGVQSHEHVGLLV